MRITHGILLLGFIAGSTAVHAQESGVFAGLDLLGGTAFGTSSTTNGGAPWAGKGIVDNVTFGLSGGVGAHLGYHFDGPLSVYLSYAHLAGDISWDTDFPLIGQSSHFDGSANSDILLAKLAYEIPVADAMSLAISAGLGVSLNSLDGVVETVASTGAFAADIESHTTYSPAAELGAALQYQVTDSAKLSLGGSIAYVGGFETGATRFGNLGTTDINPYKIDDVWRANLQASLRFQF